MQLHVYTFCTVRVQTYQGVSELAVCVFVCIPGNCFCEWQGEEGTAEIKSNCM